MMNGLNQRILVAQVNPGDTSHQDAYGNTFVTVSDCAAWEIDPDVEISKQASCSTNGAKKKTPGATDFKGTLKSFANATDNVYDYFRVGRKVLLVLFKDRLANEASQGGVHTDNYFVCPVLINGIKDGADTNKADAMEITISFEGNGTLFYPGDVTSDSDFIKQTGSTNTEGDDDFAIVLEVGRTYSPALSTGTSAGTSILPA